MDSFDRMLECDKFLDVLDANPKLADMFIDLACLACTGQQKINKAWSKGMQKLLNSDGLQALLKKLPQEKSLRFFNAIEKSAPDKILKSASKYLSTMKSIVNVDIKPVVKKGLKSIQKVGKGFVGKALGKCVTSPWATAVFSGASTAIVDTFKTGDVRKGIGHGVIDGIASIDEVDGAMIGATIGASLGPAGIFIGGFTGLFVGIASKYIQRTHPNLLNNMKKKVDNTIDSLDEQRHKVRESIMNIGKTNEGALAWFP